jgi:hypothetical protein
MTDTLTMPATTSTGSSSSRTQVTIEVTVDLHGYHPDQVTGYPLECLIAQAWEMGADRLRLVHGHGRHRRTAGRPVCGNNSGFLGLRLRNELECPSFEMRRYLSSTVFDRRHVGQTIVRLKKNPNPTREALDLTVLPETLDRTRYESELAWSEHLRRTARAGGPHDTISQKKIKTCPRKTVGRRYI